MASNASRDAIVPGTPTVQWLMREGASMPGPGALFGELCSRIVGEGVPITGAVLSLTSLDPVIARTRIRWNREGGRIFEEVMLHGMAASVAGIETFTLPELVF